MEKGEILNENRKVKGEKNRIVKRNRSCAATLCLTSILQPVWLGRP